MVFKLDRRSVMKAVGLAALVGAGSASASGTEADQHQINSSFAQVDANELTWQVTGLSIPDANLSAWDEIELPANRTPTDGTDDRYQQRSGVEYDNLVMARSLRDDGAAYKWRDLVRQGKFEDAVVDFNVEIYETETLIANYQFEDAWPVEYDAPNLGTGSDDDQLGQEVLTITYDNYKRVDQIT